MSHEYQPVAWQNHHRRLTREEFAEVGRRISGLHFAKEVFADDPLTMQALYAAEALYREVLRLSENDPFPEED